MTFLTAFAFFDDNSPFKSIFSMRIPHIFRWRLRRMRHAGSSGISVKIFITFNPMASWLIGPPRERLVWKFFITVWAKGPSYKKFPEECLRNEQEDHQPISKRSTINGWLFVRWWCLSKSNKKLFECLSLEEKFKIQGVWFRYRNRVYYRCQMQVKTANKIRAWNAK